MNSTPNRNPARTAAIAAATKRTYVLMGRVVAPPVAGLAFLIGAVNIALTLVYSSLPQLMEGKSSAFIWPQIFTGFSSLMLLVAAAASVWMLLTLERSATATNAVQASNVMFTRYLIGLGYSLLVTGIVTMVVIVGLAQGGHLEEVLRLGAAPTPASAARVAEPPALEMARANVLQGVLVLMALVTTILGALFYFANSLWKKFKDPDVIFDREVFWAGLWFRLAEAIVFTIAVFLFLRYQGNKDLVGFLPMLGLFIGMTVKSSEVLIFGLLERGLAAVSSFVAAGPKPAGADVGGAGNAAPVIPALPGSPVRAGPPMIAVPVAIRQSASLIDTERTPEVIAAAKMPDALAHQTVDLQGTPRPS